MSGSFNNRGELEIGDGRLIVCAGKKRSGKSVMGLLLFRSYPWDKVVIDIARDDGPWGPDVYELSGDVTELPRRWPEHQRPEHGKPMIVRYTPDPGSPTFVQDMDAVVGLALHHGSESGHCAILIHEMGVLCRSNRTPPHSLRLIMHNRHNHVTGIFCAPRIVGMDPLVAAQADVVYAFELPSAADRKRLGEDIGINQSDLDDAFHDLRKHEYLRYDSNEDKPEHEDDKDLRLVHWPALPKDVVDDVLAWARGTVKGNPVVPARR